MAFCVKTFLSCYFSNVQVEGEENLPRNKPVLLIANHTNALVDPFVIWKALDHPIRITAKSALLKNPYFWLILKLLKAITFHRADSGQNHERAQENLKAFDRCQEAIRRGDWLCIFPEGKSHTLGHIMSFKTGAARIALGYMERYPDSELWIVPLGLFFERKYQFGSRVLCKIGEPFDARQYTKTQQRVDPRAMTRFMEEKVKDVTLNYQKRTHSELIQWASEIWQKNNGEPRPLGVANPIPADAIRVTQTIAGHYYQFKELPQIQELESLVFQFRKRMKQYRLNVEELYLPIHLRKALFFLFRECELLILGMPLFLIGLIGHIVPLGVLMMGVRKISDDLDQWASNYLFGGLGLFGVYYLLIAVIGLFFHPVLTMVVLGILAYSGYFAIQYTMRFKETFQRAKTFLTFVFYPGLRNELHEECRIIVCKMNAFVEQSKRSS